ncbi:MAG: hypothetical protein R3240_12085, partial [Gammaproteobacteria bacterium]|nr:hypothetical protein [Gammaproteobacteria bacterium]
MKKKVMLITAVVMGSLFFANAYATDFKDEENGFAISYGDEWLINHALSTNVKLSLISKQKLASSRLPTAKADVNVKLLDDEISLSKYIRNDIKVASGTWKIL